MSSNQEILFLRVENGEQKWFEKGNEDSDGKYIGEIKNGKPNGTGTITSPDGKKYVGEFKDGKEHGKGTYTYPDGVKYEGEWKDGKEHVQGTLTIPDGFTDMEVGEWDDDDLYINVKMEMKLDFEELIYPNGSKYFGEWKNDKEWNGTGYDPNGKILYKYVNGEIIKQ